MKREWKPGDVALVEAGCHANRQVAMRSGSATNPGWSYLTEQGMTKWTADTAGVVTVVRPLVVIDPEDENQLQLLQRVLKSTPSSLSHRISELQAAFRSLTTPPKPDEPTGLGAVAEDTEGVRWTRFQDYDADDSPWACADEAKANRSWSDITAVRVLSEGV